MNKEEFIKRVNSFQSGDDDFAGEELKEANELINSLQPLEGVELSHLYHNKKESIWTEEALDSTKELLREDIEGEWCIVIFDKGEPIKVHESTQLQLRLQTLKQINHLDGKLNITIT